MENWCIPRATESRKQSPPPAASPITKPLGITNAPQEFKSVFSFVIVKNTNIGTYDKRANSYLQFWHPLNCLIPTISPLSNTYINSQQVWKNLLPYFCMEGGVHFCQTSTAHDVLSVKSSYLQNDRSNTWLSASSSAVRTGAHPYWICSNR